MRLNKYLAAAGIASRREADRLIAAGRVIVNGQPALPGVDVGEDDEIFADGRLVNRLPRKVVLAYYKPPGVTCTAHDEHAEQALGDLFDYPERVTYAGRLDKDSEGLLLMTNDGDLIERMMRGGNGHEKEYQVRVDKKITAEFLVKMSAGVYLPELDRMTGPCQIAASGRNGFTIVLTQGVNRQIKRMCQELGFLVTKIKRVRVVNIRLGDLKPGEYCEIVGREREMLYRACGLAAER